MWQYFFRTKHINCEIRPGQTVITLAQSPVETRERERESASGGGGWVAGGFNFLILLVC